MAADPGLLAKAKAAGDRLADAERQALLARADYHTAVRRLHLAGSPLREIAQALSMSHQRVQQVVSAAGGSWWQVWRRRNQSRDAVCSWCDRSPSEVAKLVAGPKVFICDACIESAERVVSGDDGRRGGWTLANGGARGRCGFCNKRATEKRSLVIGPANVCSECLHVCRDILESRA